MNQKLTNFTHKIGHPPKKITEMNVHKLHPKLRFLSKENYYRDNIFALVSISLQDLRNNTVCMCKRCILLFWKMDNCHDERCLQRLQDIQRERERVLAMVEEKEKLQ